jgi:hypothetical protein
MRDAQGERRVKATFRRSAMIGNPSTPMNKSASLVDDDERKVELIMFRHYRRA